MPIPTATSGSRSSSPTSPRARTGRPDRDEARRRAHREADVVERFLDDRKERVLMAKRADEHIEKRTSSSGSSTTGKNES
jgi:hypothetical protein